ncbi:MAG: 4-alpha-glucanotransferase [Deltaproteobacteria bacterium]|nr:4-alpha-glucanotransferase [Deltaproteobacteria bacterium]
MKNRESGILLHITSLPSSFGIGDLGPAAYRFVEFLADADQRCWQILPLNPTDLAYGNSPYHSGSAFAGNPLLISPELLVRDGLLSPEQMASPPRFPRERVDFQAVVDYKGSLLQWAFERFKEKDAPADYFAFCDENAYWLHDFALFAALKSHYRGRVWSEWPGELRDRDPEALDRALQALSGEVDREKFIQYLFFRQWRELRRTCAEKGIQIIGDLPIYVVYDSADLWVHPHLFNLDQDKRPLTAAGVPPDYFSETGQLWGNPVYRWEVMRRNGYAWWRQRISHNLALYDILRMDHFRGFVGYWEVPAGEKNAVKGRWIQAPAMDFFKHITEAFPSLPAIAEDLGTITPDVTEVMDHFGFPGMKVLLFAFGGNLGTNPYVPHNHVENCVLYTGTHDNNTVRAWFEEEAAEEDKARLFTYIGREIPSDNIHWELIRMAMMSVSRTVVFPMQDILGLGAESRMNRPSKKDGNWQWRLLPEQISPELAERLREMVRIYGRNAPADR